MEGKYRVVKCNGLCGVKLMFVFVEVNVLYVYIFMFIGDYEEVIIFIEWVIELILVKCNWIYWNLVWVECLNGNL